jgi:hypothetical protein
MQTRNGAYYETDEIQTFSDEIMMFWQQVKEATYGDKTPMFSSLSDFVFN